MCKVSESQPEFMLPGPCNKWIDFLSFFLPPIKINVRNILDCSIKEKNILFQRKKVTTGYILVLLEVLPSPPAPGAICVRTRVPTGDVPKSVPTMGRAHSLPGFVCPLNWTKSLRLQSGLCKACRDPAAKAAFFGKNVLAFKIKIKRLW